VVDVTETEGPLIQSVIDPTTNTIDPNFIRALARVESGGDAAAENTQSSATGLFQFIKSTWLEQVERHAPELTEGLSQEEILELRKDPAASAQVVAGFTRENAQVLLNAGFSLTPGRVYLAHFAGVGGALKVLRGDPTALISDVLSQAVVDANPPLQNADGTSRDIAFLRTWVENKIQGVN
jgi:hypothetical protein